mgnify:CR=1 FL=1
MKRKEWTMGLYFVYLAFVVWVILFFILLMSFFIVIISFIFQFFYFSTCKINEV